MACHEKVFYRSVTMKACSSREAAKKLGVSLMTLQRCIADGSWIKAPKLQMCWLSLKWRGDVFR